MKRTMIWILGLLSTCLAGALQGQVQTSVSEDFDFRYGETVYRLEMVVQNDGEMKMTLRDPSKAADSAITKTLDEFEAINFRTNLKAMLKALEKEEVADADLLSDKCDYEKVLYNVKNFYAIGSKRDPEGNWAGHFEFEDSVQAEDMGEKFRIFKKEMEDLNRYLGKGILGYYFSEDRGGAIKLSRKTLRFHPDWFLAIIDDNKKVLEKWGMDDGYFGKRLDKAYWKASRNQFKRMKSKIKRYNKRAMKMVAGRSGGPLPSSGSSEAGIPLSFDEMGPSNDYWDFDGILELERDQSDNIKGQLKYYLWEYTYTKDFLNIEDKSVFPLVGKKISDGDSSTWDFETKVKTGTKSFQVKGTIKVKNPGNDSLKYTLKCWLEGDNDLPSYMKDSISEEGTIYLPKDKNSQRYFFLSWNEEASPYGTSATFSEGSSRGGIRLKVNKLEIKVEQGTIDKMFVFAENKLDAKDEYKFRSLYPIPLKSIDDIYFKNKKLYSIQQKDGKKQVHVFRLSDLMKYHPILGKSRDYSPADGTYYISQSQLGDDLWVKRPDLRYFLRGEVFTDVQGFGADKPNGLVQLELAYLQNLNANNARNSRVTWFSTLGLAAQISKIENKVRVLPLETQELLIEDNGDRIDSTFSYFRTLEFMRYSNFRLNPHLNIYKRISERLNNNFIVDLAFPLYGAIAADADSSSQQFAWGIAPELKIRFDPLNKLRFEVMAAPTLLFFFNQSVQGLQYRPTAKGEQTFESKKWAWLGERFVLRTQMTLSYTRNGYDNIYIRPALAWSINKEPVVFWQAQVGYSIDIQKLLTAKKPEDAFMKDF